MTISNRSVPDERRGEERLTARRRISRVSFWDHQRKLLDQRTTCLSRRPYVGSLSFR